MDKIKIAMEENMIATVDMVLAFITESPFSSL